MNITRGPGRACLPEHIAAAGSPNKTGVWIALGKVAWQPTATFPLTAILLAGHGLQGAWAGVRGPGQVQGATGAAPGGGWLLLRMPPWALRAQARVAWRGQSSPCPKQHTLHKPPEADPWGWPLSSRTPLHPVRPLQPRRMRPPGAHPWREGSLFTGICPRSRQGTVRGFPQ